jgi:hypothetical protein
MVQPNPQQTRFWANEEDRRVGATVLGEPSGWLVTPTVHVSREPVKAAPVSGLEFDLALNLPKGGQVVEIHRVNRALVVESLIVLGGMSDDRIEPHALVEPVVLANSALIFFEGRVVAETERRRGPAYAAAAVLLCGIASQLVHVYIALDEVFDRPLLAFRYWHTTSAMASDVDEWPILELALIESSWIQIL